MAGELETARRLALDAGSLIAKTLTGAKRIEYKSEINLVTETDQEAESMILAGLAEAFPDHSVVAEESAASKAGSGPCWYVDPLDGTMNFVHGLPHCAVSIALIVDSRPQVAVVYDPCKQELFEAKRRDGATLNGNRIEVSRVDRLADSLMVTGFPYDRREHLSYYLKFFEAFMARAHDLRRLGSAALDLCYVAAGRFDGFWEWKLHPWDTAAGWLMVEEAGGQVTDFDRSGYDPWLPRIAATNGRIHRETCQLLTSVMAGAKKGFS